MADRRAAGRQAEFRQRQRKAGLKQVSFWLSPEDSQNLTQIAMARGVTKDVALHICIETMVKQVIDNARPKKERIMDARTQEEVIQDENKEQALTKKTAKKGKKTVTTSRKKGE